jgi:hypothetical protein
MVRPVGILVALLFTLTLETGAPAGAAPPAGWAGEPAGAAVARRPALHPKDEGEFVHAISRARAARPLAIDRA